MRKIFILTSIFLLCSCATQSKYENKLKYWVGKNETELVSKWGIPTSSYQTNDAKFIQYNQDFGSTSTAQPIGSTYLINTHHEWCKTTFTVDSQGIISNWRIEGTSCVSY